MSNTQKTIRELNKEELKSVSGAGRYTLPDIFKREGCFGIPRRRW